MIELEHLIGATEGDLVLSIEPVRGRLGLVRAEIRRYLDERTIDHDPWLLVADELVANAVDAAVDAASTDTAVAARPGILSLAVRPVRVVLTVANVGPAFELPDADAMPPPGAARGRGLPLVRALVDGIEVRRVEGVNVVRCWRARARVADVMPSGR